MNENEVANEGNVAMEGRSNMEVNVKPKKVIDWDEAKECVKDLFGFMFKEDIYQSDRDQIAECILYNEDTFWHFASFSNMAGCIGHYALGDDQYEDDPCLGESCPICPIFDDIPVGFEKFRDKKKIKKSN
jgi:hypothetical protein